LVFLFAHSKIYLPIFRSIRSQETHPLKDMIP